VYGSCGGRGPWAPAARNGCAKHLPTFIPPSPPMATVFSPTHGEVTLVNQIFAKHDTQKFGIITGEVAVNIFGSANLSATTLSQIWGIADADNQGFLTRKGVSVAVRLLGWAQKGEAISAELVNKRERDEFSPPRILLLILVKAGPLPVIDEFSSSTESRRAISPSPKSPGTSRLPPPLTAQDKTKFAQYFSKCNPVNGLISGMCMDMFFHIPIAFLILISFPR
jgi:epidermal growth factor receptor substrate 15